MLASKGRSRSILRSSERCKITRSRHESWLARVIHPDRWMLWMGILFIACVYYFPTGIVGKLRGTAR